MKRFALLSILATIAVAQTTIPVGKLRAPEASPPTVLVCMSPVGNTTGAAFCTYAELGFGITLDATDPTKPKITTTTVAPTPIARVEVPATLTEPITTYRLAFPPTGHVEVFVNGLRLSPGKDYTLVGQVVTFKVPVARRDDLLFQYF